MRKKAVRFLLFLAVWAIAVVVLWRLPGVRGGLAGFLRPLVDLSRGSVAVRPENDVGALEQIEVLRLREAERRAIELERLLDFRPSTDWTVVPAPVIGRDPVAWDLSFRIGKGAADGVRQGAAVMGKGVVVGRIVDTSRRTAVVETLLAPTCRIGVRLTDSGGVGVLSGKSGGRTVCLADYLDRDLDYRVGEAVVTSGLSQVIPRGLPVGKVVPWDEMAAVRIVNGCYAQLRVRTAVIREDFRYVWVVSLTPLTGADDPEHAPPAP